ncbi:unnamed protein product [Rotaria magnacalcarata]|uniref:Uncharacterized protein n=1 Tax=Rotaria magnacalcarata TaxID=392030 RepID=A0A820B2L7_9BILA|nr:unnamed protein product [Rotaria magnacalcarata]CAF4201645.1 unnamed protein product [Rotaria magnacalcarata]
MITSFTAIDVLLLKDNSHEFFSNSNYKSPLYNIIRQSRSQDEKQTLLKLQLFTDLTSTITSPSSSTDESDSTENIQEIKVQTRDFWDSDDDAYFKWASLNRRPMESLAGRKRAIEKIFTGTKNTRINTAVWRSGLVD